MKEKFLTAFKEALEIEDQEIKLSDEFRDYEEWDSIAQLSLIAMLDEEFDLQIEGDEFDKLKTVEDLLKAVEAKAA
jgi:acyl carrier protein